MSGCFCIGACRETGICPNQNPCADPAGWPPRFLPRAPAPTQQGWVCPVCGRGNAPLSTICPCRPLPPPEVTC